MKHIIGILGFSLLLFGNLAAQQEAVSVPFSCDFNTRSSMDDNWTTLDANGDGLTWGRYTGTDADANPDGGYVGLDFNADMASDDYLISRPITLQAGTNHIVFYVASQSQNFTERIALLYGPSENVEEMDLLQEFEFAHTDFQIHVANIEISEAGNYHFAFRACSEADRMGIKLDNVTIDAGRYNGVPDLVVESLLIPSSGCELGTEERIGVRLRNQGTDDINRITLSYQIGSQPKVEQSFNRPSIPIGNSRDFYFSTPADLSAPDMEWEIRVSASVETDLGRQPEQNTANNGDTGLIKNFMPVDIPFESDFSNQNGADMEDWAAPGEGWEYESSYYEALLSTNGTPLVSRCLNLSPERQYEAVLTYLGGADVEIFTLYDDLDILCGPSGTDMAEWDTVFSIRGSFTNWAFENPVFFFTVPEEGTYHIAIVPLTNNGSLYVRGFGVIDAGPAPSANEAETPAEGIHLYPNPAHDQIHIVADASDLQQISIYDLGGKLLLQSPALNGSAQWQYNVSTLAAGTYVAEVTNLQGRTRVIKFIVK